MTYIPAHRDAVNDQELRGAPLQVYDALIYELEPHSYRVVKVISLAFTLRVKPVTVRKALGLLVSRGYLEIGRGDGRSRSYRLCLTRRVPKEPLGDHPKPAA